MECRSGNSEPARAKLLAAHPMQNSHRLWGPIPSLQSLGTQPLDSSCYLKPCPALPLAITKALFGFCAGQTRGPKNWAAAATITLTLGCAGTHREGKYVPLPCARPLKYFPENKRLTRTSTAPRQPQKRNPYNISYALPCASSPPPMPLLPRKVAWNGPARVKLHTPRRMAWLIHPSGDAIPARNGSGAWEKHSISSPASLSLVPHLPLLP